MVGQVLGVLGCVGVVGSEPARRSMFACCRCRLRVNNPVVKADCSTKGVGALFERHCCKCMRVVHTPPGGVAECNGMAVWS